MATSAARGRLSGGLRIAGDAQEVATIDALCELLALAHRGVILEHDIDVVATECDLHQRRRRDAEVLCTLAANCVGDALELGTSHGRGTFKIASNLRGGVVHTVNVLPEEAGSAGHLVTHFLSRDEIGAFYRARGVTNVDQIYANLRAWRPPATLRGLGLAFVDACHDAEAVRADSHLAWECLAPGGYLIWHDWSPRDRGRFDWIDAVMRGVSAFLDDIGWRLPVLHLRDSWIGVVRRPPVAF